LSDIDQPPALGLVNPRQIVNSLCSADQIPRVIFIPNATDYPLYAVYCNGNFGPATNSGLYNARNGAGIDVGVLQRQLGMWKYEGVVKSPLDWAIGAGVLVALFILGYAEMRQRVSELVSSPGQWNAWTIGALSLFVIFSVVLPFIAIPIALLVSRRSRTWGYIALRIWLAVIILFVLLMALVYTDAWAIWATLFVIAVMVITFSWTRSDPERLAAAFVPAQPTLPVGSPATYPATPRPAQSSAVPSRPSPSQPDVFTVKSPDELPNFKNVGGMEALKKEIRDTVGLMLACRDEAELYKVSWNGFLLYGPPGVGKSFIARAIAGEFGLNFIPVSPSELTSSYLGESARLISQAFEFAHDHAPCLLFFDEFDSLAAERERSVDPERRSIVNQLLRSLEENRDEHEVIVVAATNDLDHLDPAAIRPGRFDYHLFIGYPDQEARRAILASQLAGIPIAADLDLNDLARRLDGSSAADIASIVRKTALDVFREKVKNGHESEAPVTQAALLATIANRGGHDRPTVGRLHWDEIILPVETKAELIELQRMIEDPELGHNLGVEPPTGVLLYGPPGTGKTTIARVLASETKASFYPVSATDILTTWFGESERNIRKLFDRARANRPSIIFIDELDALAQHRTGFASVQDSIVNQLLHEIDGMSTTPGVFVIGATNRPDVLDPAMLRGGRLSRQIQIPLPDKQGRAALLKLMTTRMPLTDGVDPLAYVDLTEGYSGADIEALCQQAAQEALSRLRTAGSAEPPRIESIDFEHALKEFQEQRAARTKVEGA
jgi:transitional endoplasmic reticulum ATPase